MTGDQQAFLDMIATSEGTISKGDDGYNVVVGGTLFHNDYVDHPRIKVYIPTLNIWSTAAGRYQILARYFDVYKKQLDLPDFGHESQDKIALQMISECHAMDDIEQGNLSSAISKCASRWASLPGNSYGQHQQKMDYLEIAFKKAGGNVA